MTGYRACCGHIHLLRLSPCAACEIEQRARDGSQRADGLVPDPSGSQPPSTETPTAKDAT